ncbi:LexA-binding, inner membrane-associated putative hydrolase [uncultured archaeon]|nr:LexA-binding, inner membrane-associated putative hydrolase [uncultured archaeon]
MPEPLIHFIIPFFLLVMLGFNLRKAALISLLAVIPDLDVIFHVHRSISHSIIFILVVTVSIILILNYFNKKLRTEMMVAVLVILSHPFMDVFTGYTPILWPLFNKSVYIFTELTTNMNNVFDLNLIFKVNFDKIIFLQTTNSDAPIFTSQGVGISLVLLAGLAMKNISIKIHSTTDLMRYYFINLERRNKKWIKQQKNK